MRSTRSDIRALRAQGCSVAQIARALDLAPVTVRYHLRRLVADPERDQGRPDEGNRSTAARQAPTRCRVRELLDEGLARNEIAARLGLSKAAVTYHARRLGEPIDERCARRYDWPAIQCFYDEGHSMRQCAERFGFSPASWSQAVQRGAITPRPHALTIEELCVEGRPRGRDYLKTRLENLQLLCPNCHSQTDNFAGRRRAPREATDVDGVS